MVLEVGLRAQHVAELLRRARQDRFAGLEFRAARLIRSQDVVATRQQVAAHASGGFLLEARNVVLLGSVRVREDTPRDRARDRRRTARAPGSVRDGDLWKELARRRPCGLVTVDEVGDLPFEQDAANLFSPLVSSRWERASLILTSNLPFSGWGGVFGHQAVVVAMTDRIVPHADVLTLKGASYRLLRGREIESLPASAPPPTTRFGVGRSQGARGGFHPPGERGRAGRLGGGGRVVMTSAWRASDVVEYDLLREAAAALSCALLEVMRRDPALEDALRDELMSLRRAVADVYSFDRASVADLKHRVEARLAKLKVANDV